MTERPERALETLPVDPSRPAYQRALAVELAGAPGHAGVAAASDQLAGALGALNAAHANPAALAAAAPVSEVGRIAAYDWAMLAALALPD